MSLHRLSIPSHSALAPNHSHSHFRSSHRFNIATQPPTHFVDFSLIPHSARFAICQSLLTSPSFFSLFPLRRCSDPHAMAPTLFSNTVLAARCECRLNKRIADKERKNKAPLSWRLGPVRIVECYTCGTEDADAVKTTKGRTTAAGMRVVAGCGIILCRCPAALCTTERLCFGVREGRFTRVAPARSASATHVRATFRLLHPLTASRTALREAMQQP